MNHKQDIPQCLYDSPQSNTTNTCFLHCQTFITDRQWIEASSV